MPGQPREIAGTETRADYILGPVIFTLSNLRVYGRGTIPAEPSNSPFIIAEDEEFDVSVDVQFNRTPLTELLMCLGTRVCVDFGFEGIGVRARETNIEACIVTQKGLFKYTVQHTGRPDRHGLNSGLYEIGAVATVGPVENECTTKIWGHGYIKEVLLQVYPSYQD
ncbi:MAG TPA: hypothetical protein IGS53_14110 [Leptolyngbyaceae cyanobacterium M33_DOE_097]|uniref:Uncharacterized protein n=1 Tax=Oscillatoriales cyanobacterium SpSt-418 TaxID=2282169 RepID=A0A7C3KIX1_9CYAN|nr:hypothetical protein [Leptolyngbyaceae cyanobacterium M33_DOE_097]